MSDGTVDATGVDHGRPVEQCLLPGCAPPRAPKCCRLNSAKKELASFVAADKLVSAVDSCRLVAQEGGLSFARQVSHGLRSTLMLKIAGTASSCWLVDHGAYALLWPVRTLILSVRRALAILGSSRARALLAS